MHRLSGGGLRRSPPARTNPGSHPGDPNGSTGTALEQIATAKRICRACQAVEECLEFALATNQEAGIWGGTTEEERRKLRKLWLTTQRGPA